MSCSIILIKRGRGEQKEGPHTTLTKQRAANDTCGIDEKVTIMMVMGDAE
jgi:hypothetical protein